MGEVFYEKGKKYNCTVNGTPYFRKSATINGKRHNFYGDGEKDANNKIEEAKNLASAGFDFDKHSSKVGYVFKYWLFNVKRVDIKIKASTFARYETVYRNYVEPYPIARMLLAKLDSATMQAYVTALYEEDHKTHATLLSVVKVWKMFLRWAQDEGYLVKNPCRNLAIPGKRVYEKDKIEIFSEAERAAMFKYMDEHIYQYDTLVKLAFATGMREGELLGLRWSDIDGDCINVSRSTAVVTHIDKEGNKERYREVWDTKTANSVRTIPMLPSTVEMLKEHKAKQMAFMEKHRLPISMYVFTTNTGRLVDANNLRRSFKRMLKSAGVPYRRFHCIRHTFATEAIRRGVDVKDLQKLLGHSEVETTYIYVQSDNDSKRAAIERMGAIV